MTVKTKPDFATPQNATVGRNFASNARLTSVFGAALLSLAACMEVPDNPSRQGPGGTQIQLVHGRNCWNNLCFYYNANRNMVAVKGREFTRPPIGVDSSDGFVSPEEFRLMSAAARTAPLPDRT